MKSFIDFSSAVDSFAKTVDTQNKKSAYVKKYQSQNPDFKGFVSFEVNGKKFSHYMVGDNKVIKLGKGMLSWSQMQNKRK